MKDHEQKIGKLVAWIRKTVPKGRGLLIPISGGSDSALCFWLCAQALPKQTLAVFAGEKIRAEKWFRKVGKIRKIPSPPTGENREVLRWAKFLELNLKEKRVLVGTRNRTEDALGTYSLASRVAAYLPIAGIWKSEVIELCEYIGVPEEVIASSRRADPECGRPKELAEIPIAHIDTFLKVKEGIAPRKKLSILSRGEIAYLEKLYARNRFKGELPVKGAMI